MSTASLEAILAVVLKDVWRASWQASLLAALVLIIQTLFTRRLGGRGRYLLWSIVLLRLLLPVLPESRFSVFNLSLKNESRETTNFKSQISNSSSILPQSSFSTDESSPRPSPGVLGEEVKTSSFLPRAIIMLWLFGIAALSIRVMRECLRTGRLVRELREISDAQVHAILESCAGSLGLRQRPRVLRGDAIRTPAVVGLWRPVLLLPSEVLQRCDQAQISMIVMHELAHLKRRDIAVNWVVTVAAIIHWFNPLVWLTAARIRADRELACDELVLSRAGNSGCNVQSYGNTLLALVELLSPAPPQGQLVGILESSAPLERRIRMIARFDPKASGRWAWPVVMVMVLGIAFLTDAVSGQGRRSGNPAIATPATQPVPAADGQAGPTSDDDMRKILDRVLPEVRFDNVALSDVMEFMRDVSGANIVVEWRALENAGIDRNGLISMKLRNVSVGQAMDHILRDIGGQLLYKVKSGAIVVSVSDEGVPVSTARVQPKIRTDTVFYDVTDLLNMTQLQSEMAMKSLCDAVETTLEAQSQLHLHSGNTLVKGFGTKMIITTTPDGHQEVKHILAKLREKPSTKPNPAF